MTEIGAKFYIKVIKLYDYIILTPFYLYTFC